MPQNPEWTTVQNAFDRALTIEKSGATAIVLAPSVSKPGRWKPIGIRVPREDIGKIEIVYSPNAPPPNAKPIAFGEIKSGHYGGISGGMKPDETLQKTLAREAPKEISSHARNADVQQRLAQQFAVVDISPLATISLGDTVQLYSEQSQGEIKYKARGIIKAQIATIRLTPEQYQALREINLVRSISDLHPNLLRPHFRILVEMYTAYIAANTQSSPTLHV